MPAHGSSASSGERYAIRKASHAASSRSAAAGDLGVQAGRVVRQLAQPRRREGQLVGERAGVGGGAQARDEVVLVAVVGRPRQPAHRVAAAAPARGRGRAGRAGRPPRGRARPADAPGAAAFFEQIGQFSTTVVAAEGGHRLQSRYAEGRPGRPSSRNGSGNARYLRQARACAS